MPIQVFPTPSAGASYSSQPPASASSVLLDGQLVTASSISTSVTGSGAPWLLYANGAGTTTITIAGTPYTVPAGSTVGTAAYTGSQSVVVSANVNVGLIPFSYGSSLSSVYYKQGAYGLIGSTPYFVFIAGRDSATSTFSYSTNGTTWSNGTMPSSSTWVSVAYGLVGSTGYFCSFATGTSKVAYSTNGTTWTAGTLTLDNWQWMASGVFGANTYFVGFTNNTSCIYSTNGTTWNSMTVPTQISAYVGIAYGLVSGTPYFSGLIASNGYGMYSTNGTSWTLITYGSTLAGAITSAAYANGIFLCTAQNSATYYYSSNGTSYSSGTFPIAIAMNMGGGNGVFVGIGNSATGVYSSNGITWSTFVMPDTNGYSTAPVYGSVSGTGYFVAAQGGSYTNSIYSTAFTKALPIAYGIYNGATVRA